MVTVYRHGRGQGGTGSETVGSTMSRWCSIGVGLTANIEQVGD